MLRRDQKTMTTVQPVVTIGVCVKNSASTICESIDSILSQDFSHELMEIIFVDDGSQDNTLSVIQEIISKINISAKVIHTEWRGLGYARNLVVNGARGDYIVWVDGDMVLSTDYVGKLVEFMEQNPKVGIAKGEYALIPGANWIATLEIFSRAAGKKVNFNYTTRAQSRAVGTGGSIYRIEAIRQTKGFDKNLKGYGEDWDAEYGIRAAGWMLNTIDVTFRDYERYGITWKALWKNYFRRGYDLYSFSRKNKGMIKFSKMQPLAAFVSGFFHSLKIYKLTHQKKVFLLPLQYTFKMTAWSLGFIRSHLNNHF